MTNHAKVLIVDDNKSIRQIIKRILSNSNHIFFEAGTGEDALALIKETIFNVIFLDIRLPFGISGLEVFKTAKAIQPKLGKVIILTGWLEDNIKAEADKLGAFAFLDKAPLDRNAIIGMFNKALLQESE